MYRKLILLFLAASLAAKDKKEEKPSIIETIVASPADLGRLREIGLQRALLDAQQENVRLRICLEAGVTLAECGQFNADGSVAKLPKPKPAEAK